MRLLTRITCTVSVGVALAATTAIAQPTLPTGFRDSTIAGGFNSPVGMARLPDGRVLVIEQTSAQVRLIVNGAISTTDPVCTIDQVNTAGGPERGLLGIAVDPNWPASPYIYVHCDATSPVSKIRISRYTVSGDLIGAGNGALSIDVATRRDLITQLPDAAPNHNGGTLRFGVDGMLYDSIGEDAQSCMAQDDSTLHGCILRLDVTRLPATAGGPPTLDVITPPDNPQVGATNLLRRLIFAWGLRNPFRFQIDPTNNVLYIGDVGESHYEEIDRAAAGGLDFGWPIFEGPGRFSNSCDSLGQALTQPIAWYDRSGFPNGAAVMCAGAYPATVSANAYAFPSAYSGDVFFSDYFEGFMRRLHFNGVSWALAAPVAGQPNNTDWAEGMDGVSDYLIAPDGSIWYCSQYAGEIHSIAPSDSLGGGGGGGGGGGPTFNVTFNAPFPQPANKTVSFQYILSAPATVHLTIFDLNGRRVRRLLQGIAGPAGASAITPWDGLDDDGRNAPAGLYLAKLSAGGIDRTRRVMLLR